ncbi:MAG: hypothetical protein H7A53_03195 [Akkermansiaceae bacterium]|nr:hypothetical protein [Akkermansiaceae bacterium]MCP5549891.1 hypothetical protein [Akkermansiaceae bacterium]
MKTSLPSASLCFGASAAVLLAFVSISSPPPLLAGPPANQGGHGVEADFRGAIHALFDAHAELDRSVTLTEDGYRAETTSENPEVAATIQRHVREMRDRLDDGFSVRHWDPAFVEFRQYYDQLETAIEEIPGGVRVVVKGKTPEAAKVAQNHAKIISGFVAKGSEQMHQTHPVALSSTEVPAAPRGCCGACKIGAKEANGAETRPEAGCENCPKAGAATKAATTDEPTAPAKP